jgi:hypothetical protein
MERRGEGILKPALRSSGKFLMLVMQGSMRLRRDRLGKMYHVNHFGKTIYTVFRETDSRDGCLGSHTVLVVGFRLKLIRSNPFLHWLFQRICITSTPIWSGFRGFRTKLWMVDLQDKNYLGIYEWSGKDNAIAYAEWLTVILRRLSTTGSVWYEVHSNEELAEYLGEREVVREISPPAALNVK